MLGGQFSSKLCRALGHPEWTDDPRFATNQHRLERREEQDAMVAEVVRTRSTAEWEAIFLEHDVPHAPVLKVSQVLGHPQALARGMVTRLRHSRLGGGPGTGRAIPYPAHGGAEVEAPPLLGEQTGRVLAGLLGSR